MASETGVEDKLKSQLAKSKSRSKKGVKKDVKKGKGKGGSTRGKKDHRYEIMGCSVVTIVVTVVIGYALYKYLKNDGKG